MVNIHLTLTSENPLEKDNPYHKPDEWYESASIRERRDVLFLRLRKTLNTLEESSDDDPLTVLNEIVSDFTVYNGSKDDAGAHVEDVVSQFLEDIEHRIKLVEEESNKD